MSATRDLLLSDDGDIAIVNGDFATVSGADAVPQGIAIRCRLFLGEYWLDQALGVDWLGQILVKNPDPLVVRALIGDAVAATPDVTEVSGSALDLDPATREARITYGARTTYSTTVSGELTAP